MRKSLDGLYALVVHSFGKDVFQGDYFVFLNRARDRCKILFWDRDGLVVWAKRLEQADLAADAALAGERGGAARPAEESDG